jgi:hypothetical protein
MTKQHSEDIQNKLRSEKENYDNLLKDKIDITEQLTRQEVEFEQDTATVKEQDAILADLKA